VEAPQPSLAIFPDVQILLCQFRVLRRGWILFNAQKASYWKKPNTPIVALNEQGAGFREDHPNARWTSDCYHGMIESGGDLGRPLFALVTTTLVNAHTV
jgi:hypothetical protein